ncbi:MAG: mannose-1-phosphate guanylyltransferase, partial [Weeksellaceae bacterium]|nr:mannose-1-phosphate guanylyltransferase [Weeksellaceae bacterium]
MNNNYFGIIMAGGVGSRFWPLSTAEYPKQFHDVLGTGRTLLQSTFDRLKKVIPEHQIFVVTLAEYTELTLRQLPELTPHQIIAEPKGMNTAPSNLYAAKLIYEINPAANIVVAPSDHVIMDSQGFLKKLRLALKESNQKDILITLGIKPTRPDTGYGYIQFLTEGRQALKKVKTFTEKPGLELAEAFCQSGDFLWNAGIFIWRAEVILKQFKKHLPDMYESFQKVNSLMNHETRVKNIKKTYSLLQMISIDHGIMEKSEEVYVIPSSFGWTDLGTLKSLYELSNKDKEGNAKKGKHIMTYNS